MCMGHLIKGHHCEVDEKTKPEEIWKVEGSAIRV